MRQFIGSALLLVALLCSACLERKESWTINPDGSGKIVTDTIAPAPVEGPDGAKPDPAAVGRQFVAKLVSRSKGVDAWKGIHLEATADGRAHIVAMAYFPDVSKLRMEAAVPTKWSRDPQGGYTLSVVEDPAPPATSPAPGLTDEQLADKIKKARAQYQENLPAARIVLAPLKIQLSYSLPGPVTRTNILTNDGDDKVSLSLDGRKMLEAMDRAMSDDKALAESFRAGRDPDQDQNLLLEKLFGKKGPISATIAGPGKPLFDYQAEMHAAKAAQADMLKKAGIETGGK